jgi:hypothetical protein
MLCLLPSIADGLTTSKQPHTSPNEQVRHQLRVLLVQGILRQVGHSYRILRQGQAANTERQQARMRCAALALRELETTRRSMAKECEYTEEQVGKMPQQAQPYYNAPQPAPSSAPVVTSGANPLSQAAAPTFTEKSLYLQLHQPHALHTLCVGLFYCRNVRQMSPKCQTNVIFAQNMCISSINFVTLRTNDYFANT